jgi:DNA-binding NtrC family response regulator
LNELTKTVLVVDDEIFIRQSFIDYFEDRLWRPLEAKSGEQALALLEKESPHGAIVDIRLGGMDGDAFIREACLKKPKTAFVICTGSPEYDVPSDLLRLPGVSEQVFRKPVTHMVGLEEELLRLIADMEEQRI